MSTDKINVLIIVKSVDGGQGTFLNDLSKINSGPSTRQINIKIVALERPSYRKLEIPNIKFMRPKKFYPQKYSLSPINFINLLHELIWIRKEAKIFNPDIVMGIDLRCNLLAIASKVLFLGNFKTIAETHIDLTSLTLNVSKGWAKNFLKIFIRFFYERADKLVSVSKKLSLHLRQDFNIKRAVQTIYNGKDFKTGRVKPFPSSQRRIFLSIGRLSQQKDYQSLINTMELLSEDYENYELWIAGDGPEKQNLIKLVKRFHLEDKVKLLGWVKDVGRLFDKSHIFVLSSKSEGLPYVLLEAMSHGLPVVSTDAPHGPFEILEGGKYGLLVPVDNKKLLKNAILKLATNKSLFDYFSKQSLKRSRFFSEEKMLNEYRKIFIKLTSK